MNTCDLMKYREMQFDGTLEKFAKGEFERQQSLIQQAYPMREFERRAERATLRNFAALFQS